MVCEHRKIRHLHIKRRELPSMALIKQINLTFLENAKKGKSDDKGNKTIYHLHDRSYHKMKVYIRDLPEDRRTALERVSILFPETASIFEQCAYYFRAFSRSQVFLDANHRTGFFSLNVILKRKGLQIRTTQDEIVCLTEYIKGQGWIKQTEMNVKLKERDDEFEFLREWFEERLELR